MTLRDQNISANLCVCRFLDSRYKSLNMFNFFLLERSKKVNEQKKSKDSVLVVEFACISQNSQFVLVMEISNLDRLYSCFGVSQNIVKLLGLLAKVFSSVFVFLGPTKFFLLLYYFKFMSVMRCITVGRSVFRMDLNGAKQNKNPRLGLLFF